MQELRQRTSATSSAQSGELSLQMGGGSKKAFRKPVTETPNKGKLICCVIGIPVAVLVVVYPLLLVSNFGGDSNLSVIHFLPS
jgi:hypothetical protein